MFMERGDRFEVVAAAGGTSRWIATHTMLGTKMEDQVGARRFRERLVTKLADVLKT